MQDKIEGRYFDRSAMPEYSDSLETLVAKLSKRATSSVLMYPLSSRTSIMMALRQLRDLARLSAGISKLFLRIVSVMYPFQAMFVKDAASRV